MSLWPMAIADFISAKLEHYRIQGFDKESIILRQTLNICPQIEFLYPPVSVVAFVSEEIWDPGLGEELFVLNFIPSKV